MTQNKIFRAVTMTVAAASALCGALFAAPVARRGAGGRAGHPARLWRDRRQPADVPLERVDAGAELARRAHPGYVSMAWGLRHSYTTRDLEAVSHQIAWDDLRPGANAVPFRGVTWVYESGWGSDVLDIALDIALGDVTGDAYADLVATRADGSLTTLSKVNTDGYADLMAVTTSGEIQIYPNWAGTRHIA